jgi:hypothetical protein
LNFFLSQPARFAWFEESQLERADGGAFQSLDGITHAREHARQHSAPPASSPTTYRGAALVLSAGRGVASAATTRASPGTHYQFNDGRGRILTDDPERVDRRAIFIGEVGRY